MYIRTYPRGTEPQSIPTNYGGTALAVEIDEEKESFGDTEPPVCRETANPPVEDAEETHANDEEIEGKTAEKIPLFESFATGDLLLLAVAALLSQSEKPDNELLIILLFLLLGN